MSTRGTILTQASVAVAMEAAQARWNVGDRAGAVELFGEALGLQRVLVSAVDGLVEFGPAFVSWVEWPVQALLSQDDRFVVENGEWTGEAVEYARGLGDPVSLARALVNAGLARWNVGDRAGAVELFGEALGLQRVLVSAVDGLVEFGPAFVSWVEWPVQALLSQDDRFVVENGEWTGEAVEYARGLGDPVSLARALVNAGLARWRTGDHRAAVLQFTDAVRIQQDLADATGAREHVVRLADWVDWPIHALLSQEVHYAADDRDFTEIALRYTPRLDDATRVARALLNAGVSRWNTGDHVAAAGLFSEALAVQRGLIVGEAGLGEHGPSFVRWADWPIGALLTQDGRFAPVNCEIATESLDYARRLDDPTLLSSALISSGLSRWNVGERNAAAKLFREAIEVQRLLMEEPNGVRTHGPAFLRWVEWPVGTLLSQDDRHRHFCAALRIEAANVAQSLDR